jgi:hypothetical protein
MPRPFATIGRGKIMSVKQVLREIVAELEDLRASLAVIAASASRPSTTADARDAKNLAMQVNKESYDKLRAKIEALSEPPGDGNE